MMLLKEDKRKDRVGTNLKIKNDDALSSKDLSNNQGELKNPFENKNKHIKNKGPIPNTKRTIFAVLGDVLFFSSE